MAALDHEVTTTLLLSVLGFVLVVGALLVAFILKTRTRPPAATKGPGDAPKNRLMRPSTSFYPSLLKRSNCWLAVKGHSPVQVQRALALQDPRPCSWAEGVCLHADRKLFVSPAVSGWVLVIGSALPEPGEDVDACFRFLRQLSLKLGHVQYFNLNPTLNHHAWARLDFGHVVRAYAWAGETLWNQGPVTAAETDLRMRCHGYAESPGPAALGVNDMAEHNADQVHPLAARWSLDPEAIDERAIEKEWGIVGEPARRF